MPKSTTDVVDCPTAAVYTLPETLTVCGARLSWQFGAQLPTLLASEISAIVALPALAPV